MKNLHIDGPTWAFLTPEQMYDEEGKLHRAHKHYQNADIYFLTKMKKCHFDIKKTKSTLDGNIKAEILIGDPESKKFERVSLLFPLAEITYAMPSVKASFKSSDEFLFSVLLRQYNPEKYLHSKIYYFTKKLFEVRLISANYCYRILKLIYSLNIIVRHETPFEINIFDPVASVITDNEKAKKSKFDNPELHALNEVDWDPELTKCVDYSKLPGGLDTRLTIDQIVNFFGIDVGNQEVIYIGKTEKEPFDRLFPHTKLNKLDAKLLRNQYETLVIHLFGFINWEESTTSFPTTSSLSKSDAITVAEAELINYFKPIENDKFVKDDGKSEWKHIKLLRHKGYRSIQCLLDIDGQYAKFFTPHIGNKKLNRHEIDVDLGRYDSA